MLSLNRIRLRATWLLAPVFLYIARPSAELIVLGVLFAVAGGLIRAWASGTIRKNKVLATGGPYAFTRNPLYLGSFLVGLGLSVAGGSVILAATFVLLFFAIYHPVMRAEERTLEERFGDRFRDYAAHVPLFLPRLRPYRPSEPHATEFMMRRYFSHREYEFALGVAAGFLALVVKMVWF